MGRVRPFHLRCKTSGTSAVRGQLQVFQLCSCEAVVSSLTSLPAVPCEAVVSCCSSPRAVAVRGSRVFSSSLRQWPCEAVVSSLCKSSGGCRARRLYFIFAGQALFRQRPCEAVVSSVQVSGSGRAKPLSSLYKFRQLPCEAVVSSLNKPSGRGWARQSYHR